MISNRPGVQGLQRATEAGIATRVVDHTHYPDRDSFDRALAEAIESFAPRLVVLAGFMRILTDAFVRASPGACSTSIPRCCRRFRACIPTGAHSRPGSIEHGASVHFVTAELDGGPVIAQARVAVEPGIPNPRWPPAYCGANTNCCRRWSTGSPQGALRLQDDRVWLNDQPLREPVQC